MNASKIDTIEYQNTYAALNGKLIYKQRNTQKKKRNKNKVEINSANNRKVSKINAYVETMKNALNEVRVIIQINHKNTRNERRKKKRNMENQKTFSYIL